MENTKQIKFGLTTREYKALSRLANDGKHQPQTPDELAHDVVIRWMVEQSKERP